MLSSPPVGRTFLALWLGVFAGQSANLLAIVVPDDCTEAASESRHTDPCPDDCVQCVCCARTTVVTPPAVNPGAPELLLATLVIPEAQSPVSPYPPDILHVPKAR